MTHENAACQSGTAWTEEQACQSAQALLATVDMGDAGLELLRFGNNAVFRAGQRYVIRVARPDTPIAHIRQEVEVATALADQGVPVARLATLPVSQPLTANDAYGTLWEYLPGAGEATYQQFGALLRAFHAQTDTLAVQLPDWQPLASARRRLDVLAGQYPPEDIALLEHWYERIQDALSQLEPALPEGIIHGQAEIGNVLLRDGQPVFADLERVAHGWREWDLIDTAVTTLRFNQPRDRYQAFAAAYEYDVMVWPGFLTLRRVWELRATTWLMQARDHRPEIADEVQGRLGTWRDDDPDAVWYGF
jgi:Ser/Thr protein kinase RdoA (MazF antagonist)